MARHQHAKFGQIMAEYSLAAVINMERNMTTMIRNQIKREWDKRQAKRVLMSSENYVDSLAVKWLVTVV